MALIQCPECEGKVSNKAKACIHCGCPLDECSAKGNRLDGDCSYSVVMNSCGCDKIAVIKVVREFTGLGLKEAKDLVEAAPVLIAEGLSGAKAEGMRCSLEEAGADVSAVESSKLDDAFAKSRQTGEGLTTDGFWFMAAKGATAELECGKCGKLSEFPSSLVSSPLPEGCTAMGSIACPDCGNRVAEGSRVPRKGYAPLAGHASQDEDNGGCNVALFGLACFAAAVVFMLFGAFGVALVLAIVGGIGWLVALLVGMLSVTPEEKQRQREASDRSKYNGLKYTCPMCGGHKVKSIGTAKKLGGVAAVGLASQNIGKNYQCDDCNYRW